MRMPTLITLSVDVEITCKVICRSSAVYSLCECWLHSSLQVRACIRKDLIGSGNSLHSGLFSVSTNKVFGIWFGLYLEMVYLCRLIVKQESVNGGIMLCRD